MPDQNQARYVPAGTGPLYWGPGDRVTFLVTGEQSGGACFIIAVTVPPGGGPPPPRGTALSSFFQPSDEPEWPNGRTTVSRT